MITWLFAGIPRLTLITCPHLLLLMHMGWLFLEGLQLETMRFGERPTSGRLVIICLSRARKYGKAGFAALPFAMVGRCYTATGTWKVDITVSNAWIRGVPSITFAKVFNTWG
jgi:hypothetical protein